MTDVLIAKTLGNLARLSQMSPASVKSLFKGGMETAEAAINSGLLLLVVDSDPALLEAAKTGLTGFGPRTWAKPGSGQPEEEAQVTDGPSASVAELGRGPSAGGSQ